MQLVGVERRSRSNGAAGSFNILVYKVTCSILMKNPGKYFKLKISSFPQYVQRFITAFPKTPLFFLKRQQTYPVSPIKLSVIFFVIKRGKGYEDAR